MSINLGGNSPKKITMRTASRLPAEYQEVEYIQSSGTQYITTNIIPSDTKGIYLKLSSQDISNDLLYIGSRKTTDTRFWIGNNIAQLHNCIYLGWNTFTYYQDITANTIYEIKLNYLNDRKKQVDSTVVLSNIGTLSSSNNIPIAIFAGNEDGTIITPSQIKLYSCQITDNGDIVNDFVPCYRKLDSVIGLYDIVNSQFYTNAGSGTFTKGNDVNFVEQEIKRVTIRPNGTEKQIRPAIPREPNVNTLLYLPLESDVVDQSGKTGRTFSTSGITYTTVGGVTSAHVGTTGGILLTAPYPLVTTSTTEQTISFIYYTTTQQSTARRMLFEFRVTGKESIGLLFYENTSNFMFSSDNDSLGATIIANSWTHVACVCSSAGRYIYVNGQLANSGTGTSTPRGNRPNSYQQNQAILCGRGGLDTDVFNGNIREIIMEDKAWTADEVSDYYIWIKSKLGF